MEDKKLIRILFAEDNKYDLQLAIRELSTSGLTFLNKCVETKAEFEKELDFFKPDIIISDYFLTDFDGLSILETVFSRNPDLPVIITTGSINEETAVKCMKAGAADYVLKDQLRRLPFSVKEVLNKKAIRQEKEETEIALRQSESRFSLLLNNISNIAVQCYTADGIVKYWNKASENIYQYTANEALGQSLYDLIIPDEIKDFVKRDVRKMIETGIGINSEEIRLKRKDGSLVDLYSSHSVLESGQGEKELYCIDIDITDRIRVENDLLNSELKYRNLVENSFIGIYQSTLQGELLFVNEAFVRLLGYESPDELALIPAEKIYSIPNDRKVLLQSITKNNSISGFETVLVTKNGQKKHVIINASLEFDRIAGMVLDITERKTVENELIKAKEKAEESDRLKSSFLANLSHEVRTPMNGIVGFAELLLEDEIDVDSKRLYVETITQNSYQLLKIISDIIEISKIETEQLTINNHEFSLNSMIGELERLYAERAFDKSLNFSFSDICDGENLSLVSDEAKIRLILSHLLDNAIKFTETGSIRASCKKSEKYLDFYIEDTGCGVPKAFEELIFEPFRQADDSYNRNHGGNGLGLSIARAYVELLGGNIWLESNTSSGAVFAFRLPMRFKPDESLAALNSDSIESAYSGFTFLIAEDEITNFVYLKKLLIHSGAIILHASNGKEAIDIVSDNPAVDLIFMDIKMPVIDGIEATRHIKKSHPSLPIIATTAYAMTGDRELCLASGCDGYVSKPIRKNELYRIIKKVMISL
ncbi:MAG: response regulator [Lentimicrobium sp.]|nr:response regulator [Lentimicrobium sp.]